MNTQTRVTRKQRTRWPAWAGFVLFLVAAPVNAREKITLQASATDPQLRAGNATLNQASPGSNNVGPTLTVESLAAANQRAIVEFDLSRIPNVAIKQATLTLHVITPPPLSAGTLTYGAYNVTDFWQQPAVTWQTRVATTGWTTAGGDFGAATSTATVTNASTTVQFNITANVQTWFNATADYGTIIKDQTESDATATSTVFGSKTAVSLANAPELDVTFVQNVTGLTATPANAAITLKWNIPSPIGIENPGEPYTGVLILRRTSYPVDKSSVPTDTTSPALCATVGTGTVVFSDTTGLTTFTDNAADTCGAPANGTTYFYKVFLRDQLNYYSSQPIANGSVFTEEISATPAATVAAQQNSQWIAATYATDLATPSLIPGSVVVVGSQLNLLFMINANTGLRMYAPVSLGGPVVSRSSLIDSGSSSTAQNVIYVADNDGLVYAVATDTGVILWVVNPNASTTNAFQGSAAVQLKSLSTASYTRTNDLVTVGTRNTATTTANQILGIDGNTGATAWTTTGGSGGVLSMDIMSSTPEIDYVNGAIWVTSRSACGTSQPSLWKLNPNTGAVLANANLGDTDTSPVLSFLSDVLFVANNGDSIVSSTCTAGNSVLYAINPVTGATLNSYAPADGVIVTYPVVVNNSSPYTILFSGATAVHAVSYNVVGNTFTSLWNRTINVPSAPISYTGSTYVFVGSNDGKIHELNLATGADVKDEVANTGQPGFVGDPSLDIVLSRIYVSTTDQRAYGFTYPF
jgi:hypothetical protein